MSEQKLSHIPQELRSSRRRARATVSGAFDNHYLEIWRQTLERINAFLRPIGATDDQEQGHRKSSDLV
jgi:hypothetical protein